MSAICRERFEAFGTAGHAATIKVIPMSEMAKRYEKGVLDPNIPVAKAA
jgi:fructose-bisphosphate aldolase class II